MILEIVIHHSGRYQEVTREKLPGEILPFKCSDKVIDWEVPPTPGEYKVTTMDDEGMTRILATITVKP